MPTINGKEVVLIDRLTGKQWWELGSVAAAFEGLGEGASGKDVLRKLDWEDLCTLVRVMVASWEFDAPVGDPDVLESLGIEVVALGLECLGKMGELAPNAGESASART